MKSNGTAQRRNARAWDVGAGAGVSTETLWRMGYRQIEAIDWSTEAWMKNVEEEGINPKGVVFTAMDDETFMDERIRPEEMEKFDAIVFNFGVNKRKAIKYAKEFLNEDGRLLAPVNTQSDYWLKLRFRVYDVKGNVLWTADDVGAWSVQFQPDVTQDTCQGIWCPQYNGFKKKSIR